MLLYSCGEFFHRCVFHLYLFYNYGEGAKARRLRRVSSMDKVSERFILEYEVRDSIFFLSMIPCVVCVKCGRVFHSLSKYYSLLCLLFSVMFGVCFFAVHTNGMLSAFVNEHRSLVKHYSLLFAFVNEHRIRGSTTYSTHYFLRSH